jgi:hypothetical protein
MIKYLAHICFSICLLIGIITGFPILGFFGAIFAYQRIKNAQIIWKYEIEEKVNLFEKQIKGYYLKSKRQISKITSTKEELAAYKEDRKNRKSERLKAEQREKRDLAYILPNCVRKWPYGDNLTMKHRYYYNYYTYKYHKYDATAAMWATWNIVWGFKGGFVGTTPTYEYSIIFNKIVSLVETTLKDAFGQRTKYLTFVCLTASSQYKTECRYKRFSNIICSRLGMENAFHHIRVTKDGTARHGGGDGSMERTYNTKFFNGKYIVLFDDVCTTGASLNDEKRYLESIGAKVICAITIGQTV